MHIKLLSRSMDSYKINGDVSPSNLKPLMRTVMVTAA